MDMNQFFSNNAQPMAVGAAKAQAIIERRMRGEVFGYRFPIDSLDKYVRLLPSELLLIAARASVGKTAMALQILEGVERQRIERGVEGVTVMFSAEMAHDALVLRLASARCGVPVHDFYNDDTLDPATLRRLMEATEQVEKEVPVYVDETSAPTIAHMVEQLELLARPISLVVFDYIELAGERVDGNENQRIAEINRGLKRIAKRFNCPVVGLSQFSRDIDKRADGKPKSSDLMYGGEREADKIIGLVPNAEHDTIVDAHVLKNRNGPKGMVPLWYKGKEMKFYAAEIQKHDLNQP